MADEPTTAEDFDGVEINVPMDEDPQQDDEGQQQQEDQQQQEEDQQLLAGKYESVEDLEKAYLEAQKKISQGSQQDDAEETPEAPADGKIGEPAEEPEEAETVDPEGVTLEDAFEAYRENQEVSDDLYKALAESGLDRSTVDRFIAGQEALANQGVSELQQSVGGEETFAKVLQWAQNNADRAVAQAYNNAVDRGDVGTAKAILGGLKAQYDANVGVDPNLIEGENVPDSPGVKPFKSLDDMAEAMESEKYERDAAYRQKVDARVEVTDLGDMRIL